MHQQYIPSQALVKDQLNQIRLLTSELQAKESETSLLKDELTRLSEICYNNEKNAEMLESRYKFLLEENDMNKFVTIFIAVNQKQRNWILKNTFLLHNIKLLSKVNSYVKSIEYKNEIETRKKIYN